MRFLLSLCGKQKQIVILIWYNRHIDVWIRHCIDLLFNYHFSLHNNVRFREQTRLSYSNSTPTSAALIDLVIIIKVLLWKND